MTDQIHKKDSLALTIVSYCLSMLFLFAGLAKLWGPQMLADQFAAWNIVPSVMYMVGVIEVVAGLLLLLPSSRAIGSVLLVIIMIGAGATHFFAQQFAAMAVPAVFLLLLAWIILRSPLPIGQSEKSQHDDAHNVAAAH